MSQRWSAGDWLAMSLGPLGIAFLVAIVVARGTSALGTVACTGLSVLVAVAALTHAVFFRQWRRRDERRGGG